MTESEGQKKVNEMLGKLSPQDQDFISLLLLVIRLIFFYLIDQFLAVHCYPFLSTLSTQYQYTTGKSRILYLLTDK